MTWRVWCQVVAAAAAVVVAATSGAAVEHKKDSVCPQGEDCILRATCQQIHDGDLGDKKLKKCGDNIGVPDKFCCPRRGTVPRSNGNVTAPSGEDLIPNNDECGLRPETVYRIMFGEDAPLNAYPWIALLGYKNPSNPLWQCGGALISDRYVVTAGHCVSDINRVKNKLGKVVKVRLGEHNIATNLDCSDSSPKKSCMPPQDINPEATIIHENFHKRGLVSDDIALIRLENKAKLGPSVQPVCLPSADLDIKDFLDSRDAVVAGWGATEDSLHSKVLQLAEIPYASKSKCTILYPMPLMDEQVCFGGRGKVDTCFGDSGGPVFQSDLKTHHFTLLAVVSFGLPKCGVPGVPAVYTNVAPYRNWIVTHLKP